MCTEPRRCVSWTYHSDGPSGTSGVPSSTISSCSTSITSTKPDSSGCSSWEAGKRRLPEASIPATPPPPEREPEIELSHGPWPQSESWLEDRVEEEEDHASVCAAGPWRRASVQQADEYAAYVLPDAEDVAHDRDCEQ